MRVGFVMRVISLLVLLASMYTNSRVKASIAADWSDCGQCEPVGTRCILQAGYYCEGDDSGNHCLSFADPECGV